MFMSQADKKKKIAMLRYFLFDLSRDKYFFNQK